MKSKSLSPKTPKNTNTKLQFHWPNQSFFLFSLITIICTFSITSWAQSTSSTNIAKSTKQSSERKLLYKCNEFQRAADWHESGIAVIQICVNEYGMVESSALNKSKSANFSPSVVKILTDCASKYIYEAKEGYPTTCGEIIIRFGME